MTNVAVQEAKPPGDQVVPNCYHINAILTIRKSVESGTAAQFWPTETQELLIRACFSSPEEALAAYREWDKREGIDRIESQSYPFLPLLYRNLSAVLGTEKTGILEGTYRKTWYGNQLLLRQHSALVSSLRSAGIDTVHLEGLPLAVRYYADLGVRPMRALRLLIHQSDVKRAMTLLGELHYKITSWQPAAETPDFYRFRAGTEFRRGADGGRVDLDWRVVHAGGDVWDEFFWNGAQQIDFPMGRGSGLCPADELFLACIRELSWAYRPRLIWVADALAILRSGQAIDWPRFQRLASETGHLVPVRAVIRYLADTFEAPVPPEALQALEHKSESLSDRLLHGRLAGKKTHPLVTDMGALLAQNYRTLGRGSTVRAIVKLPRFLQYQWRLSSRSQVPGYAWRRLRLRLTGGEPD